MHSFDRPGRGDSGGTRHQRGASKARRGRVPARWVRCGLVAAMFTGGAMSAVVVRGRAAGASPGPGHAGSASAVGAGTVHGVHGANELSTAMLATPLLSPVRLPRTLQDIWAQNGLVGTLTKTMSPAELGKAGSRDSCTEVVQDGQVIYQDHPDLPVLPASNMKLLTATALLDKLGPGYRFTTLVETSALPAAGVVAGDLYLVGGGDPLLRLPSYAGSIVGGDPVYTNVTQLVTLLKAAGVRQVTGSVIGDESRYDSVRAVTSWGTTYSEQGDVGPLSALGIDDGFALGGPPVPAGASPPVQSAGVLTGLLRSAGIDVDGPPEAGKAPTGAQVLVKLVSPPLSQVLGEVLRESDNTAMELLTKELGLRVRGVGSTAAGTAAVRADLATDRLPVKGFVNADGSGLSRLDRVTCALLVAALERAGPAGVLVRDLPVAGKSGTLADELNGTVAAGRVRAKTGTLDGVKALSGWVEPVRGQGTGNPELASPVVFANVLNGLSLSLANPTALTDRVALDIAEYPTAPVLAMFEPG